MKRTFVVGAAIAAFGFVSAASAADMPAKAPIYKAPIAAPVYNWTGIYVGINGGGGWGRESWLDNNGFIPGIDFRPQGGVFGGQAGFRWQWNQFVFGVEGTWDWTDLRDTITFTGGGEAEKFKVKSLYTATGQAGWAWDRWLAYVKGGWAGASTNFDFVFTGSPTIASQPQNANGWTIGGGIDYAIWQNVILGVEYDHFDLKYDPFIAAFNTGGAPLVVTNTSRLTIDQVVARLSYKFGIP